MRPVSDRRAILRVELGYRQAKWWRHSDFLVKQQTIHGGGYTESLDIMPDVEPQSPVSVEVE